MAKGTIDFSQSKTSGKYIDSKVVWSSTPSTANNNSDVTASLYVRKGDTTQTLTVATYGTWSYTLNVGGSVASGTVSLSVLEDWVLVCTKTVNDIAHSSDGSKSITISGSVSAPSGTSFAGHTTSGSGTATFDTIARASVPTLSADSVVMLDSVTITTNRKSTSFKHDLTYEFNGYEGTIATGVEASYKWTVPDLVSKISGKSSGTCTIYCKTKSGSTVVGTKSIKLTISIPAKSIPSASASTVQMGTTVNVYTNRKSSGYTHTLTYAVGIYEGTIDTDVGSSKGWTPYKMFANLTGNKTSITCTITCKTYNGTLLVGTATTQIILTVPDATVPTLSASSIVLGNPITIYTPREVDCYEHDISYTLKAKNSNTVAFSKDFNAPIQESYEWTPSLTLLAPKIPSATEGTITITCTTRFKDSTTVVGEEEVSFAIKIPNNSTTKPKFTMALTPVHDLSSAFDSVFVQGKSKVKISYDASSDYSSIVSYETKILGVTSATSPYTSAVLSNEGTVTIVGKVTDARGYSTEKTAEIEVIPYTRPRIIPGENQNKIICTRGNSDGGIDAGGVYLLINIGRKYSKVMSGSSQSNYCSLSYQWKTDAEGEDDYTDLVELLSKTASTDYVAVALKDIVSSNTTAYNIKLVAEDDVGEDDTVVVTVPTAFATYHSPPSGHGFTLGGYHDPSKYDVFDCIFDAEFEGNVSGKVLGMGALPEIPENADANDYKDFGAFAVLSNAIAKTIANLPTETAGTLRVWSANGRGITTGGNYIYIMQEYIPYDNYASYRRKVQLQGDSWEYGDWKVISGCDAIHSQGTTDGWYWRKYANGTAECWRRVSQTVDIDATWSSMYIGDCEEVEFPFAFASAPVCNATVESGMALTLVSWQGTAGSGTTTATKPASLRVARFGAATGVNLIIAYHAIGRWKE